MTPLMATMTWRMVVVVVWMFVVERLWISVLREPAESVLISVIVGILIAVSRWVPAIVVLGVRGPSRRVVVVVKLRVLWLLARTATSSVE